ncbi:MAG: nucleotidyltransferase domain-containing protein [Gaiellaceae bacterium]
MIDAESLSYAEAVSRQLTEILGQDLVGSYLHGSAAFDDFLPDRSDIDLLAVCELPLSPEPSV